MNTFKNLEILDENLSLREKIFENLEKISLEFSPREMTYIKAMVENFENFSKTKPYIAIKNMQFPDIDEDVDINLGAEKFWNENIDLFLKKIFANQVFFDEMKENLEIFYAKMQEITEKNISKNITYTTKIKQKSILEI